MGLSGIGRLPQAGSASPPTIEFFLGTVLEIFVDDLGEANSRVQQLLLHTRTIAIDWRVLNFAPAGRSGAIILELTRNQVRLAPEYKRGKTVVVVGAGSPERAMPSSEVAAPER